MIKEILTNLIFELRIRRLSISTYVYFLMFFALALLIGLGAGGAFKGVSISFGASRVVINSPLSLSTYMAFLSSFALFIIAPAFGQAICKDYLNKMDQIVFSTPVKTRNFLLGRFLGATVFSLFVLSSIPLGVFFSTTLNLVLPSMLGPNQISTYLWPLISVALPNVLIFGAFFFFIGAKTKQMSGIYVTATLLFILWSISGQLLRDVDNRMLASLIDPIGLRALSQTIRYWTVDQQNTRFLTFESYYLWNRLLWLGLAGAAYAATLLTFSKDAKKSKRAKDQVEEVSVAIHLDDLHQPKIEVRGFGYHWFSFLKQLSFEFKQTVYSIYFIVIVLAGIGYMAITGTQVGKMFGTKTFPVTYNILDFVGGSFTLFLLIIITIYTGEAIWRDRDLKVNQIMDALPVSSGAMFLAKFMNLVLITVLLLTSIMIAGVGVQLAYGYTKFEFAQYFVDLYLIKFPSCINLIALTFFFQVVLRNKYLAHGAIVLFYLFDAFGSALGFEHFLYKFNAKPNIMYSDMNGFGHVFGIYHLYNTYWLFLSVVLLSLSYVMWHRGALTKFWPSLGLGLKSMSGSLRALNALALTGFIGLGSYLFYQTNIKNDYLTKKDNEIISVEYERRYKSYETKEHPHLIAVNALVDIYPSALQMKAHLKMKFKNMSDEPISEFLVNLPADDWTFELSRPNSIDFNEKLNTAIYKLKTPLLPNEEMEADYQVTVDNSGIENGSNLKKIYGNGTFFNNFDFFPSVGYLRRGEIVENKTRQKYGLPERRRLPAIDNSDHYRHNYIGTPVTWIDFEATVSTDSDQIALAPGDLQKEWAEGDRRYFHYKMDQKILNFYAFLSGRYKTKTDQWNDVAITVFYHDGHEYNVDRMIKGAKKSLDYFTRNFGPYQHKQYRIIEFPRYETFAQAFPNTIPFSEGIGFIARVDDSNKEDIDYPFYVTSHELAHQWWAHQLIGAQVQGSEMLSETFSQYSALMVMEDEYGRDKMKKFLKYELDRYLFGRSQEKEYENPLYLTENQPYVHYNKGSVIFYALKDYLGEELLNEAIRETLAKHATQKSPYPTSKHFIEILKSKTPPNQLGLVEDLLEKIVLFENRPLEAVAHPMDGGQYKVRLKVSSKKLYSDANGKETEAPFEQEMDIGIQNANEEYIYLKKHKIKSGENEIEVSVSEKPFKAGIDPLNVLVDRNSGDNLMAVQTVEQPEASVATR